MLVQPLDQPGQESLHVPALQRVVKIPQISAQLDFPLHQKGLEALVRHGQGGCDSGHPAADHQRLFQNRKAGTMKGTQYPGPGNAHGHQLLGLLRGPFLLLCMNPGALLPDADELEHEGIQPHLPQGVLEQHFVGAGRAGSHHHPVDSPLLDGRLDPLLGVLRAGVEIGLRVHHPRQPGGVLGHGGHIHHRANVDTAVADEHPHPALSIIQRQLRRVALGGYLGTPGLLEQGRSVGGAGRGGGHGFGDVPGRRCGTAEEDTRHAGPLGHQAVPGQEAVGIQADPGDPGQPGSARTRDQAGGQHHQLVDLLPHPVLLVHVHHPQVVAARHLLDPGKTGPPELDSLQSLSPFVVGFEVLAIGSDVHEVEVAHDPWGVFTGDDRLLDRVHAAHRGAVGSALLLHLPGAGTEHPGHLPGFCVIRGTEHVAFEGAGGGQHAFELRSGDHIGKSAVAVLIQAGRVELVRTGGQDQGPGIQLHDLLGHPVVHRFPSAGGHAEHALRARPAVQTALRLLPGRLFVKTELEALEAPDTLLGLQSRHHGAGFLFDGPNGSAHYA